MVEKKFSIFKFKYILFIILILCFFFTFFIWKGFIASILLISIVSGIIPTYNVAISNRTKLDKIFYALFAFLFSTNTTGLVQKIIIPNKYDKVIYAADKLFENKLFSQAIEDYQIALIANPNNIEAIRKLALCYFNISNLDKAIILQHQLISIESNVKNKVLLASWYFIKGYETYTGKSLNIGEAYYIDPLPAREANKLATGSRDLAPIEITMSDKGEILGSRIARLPYETEISFKNAANICNELLRKNPDNTSALQLLYLINAIRGSYREAISFLNHLILISPTSNHLLNLGACYLNAVRSPSLERIESPPNDRHTIQLKKNQYSLEYLVGLNATIETIAKISRTDEVNNRYLGLIFDTIKLYLDLFNERIIFQKSKNETERDSHLLGRKIINLSSHVADIDQKNFLAYFYLGQGYLMINNYLEASSQFETAKENAKNNEGAKVLIDFFKSISDSLLAKPKKNTNDTVLKIYTNDGFIERSPSDIEKKLRIEGNAFFLEIYANEGKEVYTLFEWYH